MRRRRRSSREQQLIVLVVAVTLVLSFVLQTLYHWWTNDSWQVSTLDWIHVPGYEVTQFIQTVERINNSSPRLLTICEVDLSGPTEVRGRQKLQNLYDLLVLDETYPDQIMIMRFLVQGPLSYYQFAEFNRLGPIQDITRRYLFSQVSVLKK